MAIPNESEIEKLKAANPGIELHQVSAGTGDREVAVIVKTPDRQRWMRFKAQLQDQHRKAVAMEGLVVDCAVWPSRGEVEQLLEQRPGLVETIGSKVAELAGLEETVTAKKL
jgi:hypothetical protein